MLKAIRKYNETIRIAFKIRTHTKPKNIPDRVSFKLDLNTRIAAVIKKKAVEPSQVRTTCKFALLESIEFSNTLTLSAGQMKLII